MNNTIFNDAKDVHVRNHVVFGKTADNKLYKKFDGTTYSDQIPQEELTELFKKKILLIQVGTIFYEPFLLNGNQVATIDKASESNNAEVTMWSALATE